MVEVSSVMGSNKSCGCSTGTAVIPGERVGSFFFGHGG